MTRSSYLRLKHEGGTVFRLSLGGWAPVARGEAVPCAPGGLVRVEWPGGPPVAVRAAAGGREVYRLPMPEEGRIYKLGPAFGYAVKMPEEETDPILRVAREVGIPASAVGAPECGDEADVPEGCDVFTDGRIAGGGRLVTGFSYVISTFTKEMRRGGSGRFVAGVRRSARLSPGAFRAAVGRIGLSHRPEWRVDHEQANSR